MFWLSIHWILFILEPAISIAFVSFGIPKQYGRDHVLGQELLSRSEIGGGAGRGYR